MPLWPSGWLAKPWIGSPAKPRTGTLWVSRTIATAIGQKPPRRSRSRSNLAMEAMPRTGSSSPATLHRQGHTDQARDWFDRAIDWIQRNPVPDKARAAEIYGFRDEASSNPWRIGSLVPRGSVFGEQLGRKVALHPVGENRDDVGLGPEAGSGHDGGPVIQARAGADRETFADQGTRNLDGLVVGDVELDQVVRLGLERRVDCRQAVGHTRYAAAERTAFRPIERLTAHRPGGKGGDRTAEIGEALVEPDQRPPGSHPADHGVNTSAGDLRDDLLRGSVSMGAGVVGVGKLEWGKAATLDRLERGTRQAPRIPSARGEKTTSPP